MKSTMIGEQTGVVEQFKLKVEKYIEEEFKQVYKKNILLEEKKIQDYFDLHFKQ